MTLIEELVGDGALPSVVDCGVEPLDAVVMRLRYASGAVRVVCGADIGVNSSSASALASNKAYTKHFLTSSGFAVPAGVRLDLRLPDSELLAAAAEHGAMLGAPWCVKPTTGREGRHVYRCADEYELRDAIVAVRHTGCRTVLVEQWLAGRQYRLVVSAGRAALVYELLPFQVIGDGLRSVAHLSQQEVDRQRASGRPTADPPDPAQLARTLARQGFTPDAILNLGVRVEVRDTANLSGGGTPRLVTDRVHARWTTLAVHVAQRLGLNHCGIDLTCESIEQDGGAYSIFEVNAAPGLEHLYAHEPSAQPAVREMYRQALVRDPGLAAPPRSP